MFGLHLAIIAMTFRAELNTVDFWRGISEEVEVEVGVAEVVHRSILFQIHVTTFSSTLFSLNKSPIIFSSDVAWWRYT